MKAMLAIRCLVAAASFLFGATAHGAELRGHGGPVRSIDIAPDGQTAITGSFDTKAIIWSLETGEAQQVLLFHESQVDAVAALPRGRYASAGADGRIAIWEAGRSTPVSVLHGHDGPVVALAVAPDGSTLASASWDTSVRLWPLSGAAPRSSKATMAMLTRSPFCPTERLQVRAMTQPSYYGRRDMTLRRCEYPCRGHSTAS